MVFEVVAGDTNNNNWTVRVGPSSSGTVWVNGIAPGTRLYGGVCISSMVIEEVTP